MTQMSRTLTLHHDGHGLNDSLRIEADALDPNAGGASHHFVVVSAGGAVVAHVDFQHGPRGEIGSSPGVTEAVLYAILLDRLRAFQAGPFPSSENEKQIKALEECLASTKARADERAARGVLGKNTP